MTNELLTLFDYYEMEKGIDRDTMVEALETALLSASKKSIGPARELRIHVDPDKGEIKAFATLLVKDSVGNPYDEIDIFTARRLQPGIDVDEELEVDITPANFGRIAAQTAKQTMMQRLRMAEKEMIYEEFKDRAGDIVSGTVRRFERGDVWIDLGKFEGVMRQRERVKTEEYNVGDRIRAYVVAVENGARGPEIILSRSHPNFVRRLFESEVSEIADRTVEIRSLAREAGYRTKVAVHSADERVDPVGACVGMRGARVKNIVRELNNEKVDIIRWSDDIKGFVEEALKPARIKTITLDEEEKSVEVTVEEEELSKAIGRRGQNARLTARLIGWDVQVQKDESAHEAMLAQIEAASEEIATATETDVNTARVLVEGGVSTLQMLANDLDEVDIADILGLSVEEGATIHARAKAAVGGGEDGDESETSDSVEEEPSAEEDAEDSDRSGKPDPDESETDANPEAEEPSSAEDTEEDSAADANAEENSETEPASDDGSEEVAASSEEPEAGSPAAAEEEESATASKAEEPSA